MTRKCPTCGQEHDAATNPDDPDDQPADGDVAVCIRCRAISVYYGDDDALSLREPTDAEMIAIAGDPKMIAMVEAVAAVQAKYAPKAEEDDPDAGSALPPQDNPSGASRS